MIRKRYLLSFSPSPSYRTIEYVEYVSGTLVAFFSAFLFRADKSSKAVSCGDAGTGVDKVPKSPYPMEG